KEDGKTYDRYRHRVMFPIHDRQGRIIGFGGRALEKDQKPKYLNSPETSIFQKSRELYGLHQVLKAKANLENIIIVEGYMDVIALAQHGLLNAVATLGTATSSYHIQLLAKHTKQIIFCFDGDNAGRQAAWRALENCLPELNKGLDVSFCFLPEEHDPDSLVRLEGTEQFKLKLKEAKQLNQYFLETISEGIDTYTVAGRTQLIIAAKPYLLKMQDGPYKDLLLNELARLTHIEAYRITQILVDNQPVAEEKEKKVITKSPIRLAIALLVQNPELFSSCKDKIDIDLLDGKNQDILQKLLRQVEKNPMANTAALVEEWRDSHFFDALTKLAGWDHQEPEQELDKKFTDIVLFLQKQNLENKINEFLAKSRNQGLTLTERLNLQDMMKRRHQQTSLKS
ncbi:MAG: toprim domain-containing protein, partial [Proteobacteria bacterium]|nr:toprim domain-containing protein [Pseudomonadota bacterium]